jgi:hypothetical protein
MEPSHRRLVLRILEVLRGLLISFPSRCTPYYPLKGSGALFLLLLHTASVSWSTHCILSLFRLARRGLVARSFGVCEQEAIHVPRELEGTRGVRIQ